MKNSSYLGIQSLSYPPFSFSFSNTCTIPHVIFPCIYPDIEAGLLAFAFLLVLRIPSFNSRSHPSARMCRVVYRHLAVCDVRHPLGPVYIDLLPEDENNAITVDPYNTRGHSCSVNLEKDVDDLPEKWDDALPCGDHTCCEVVTEEQFCIDNIDASAFDCDHYQGLHFYTKRPTIAAYEPWRRDLIQITPGRFELIPFDIVEVCQAKARIAWAGTTFAWAIRRVDTLKIRLSRVSAALTCTRRRHLQHRLEEAIKTARKERETIRYNFGQLDYFAAENEVFHKRQRDAEIEIRAWDVVPGTPTAPET